MNEFSVRWEAYRMSSSRSMDSFREGMQEIRDKYAKIAEARCAKEKKKREHLKKYKIRYRYKRR